MFIRVGFDLRLNFAGPTPLMLLLDVHPSLRNRISLEQPLAVVGATINAGTDFYGNRMQRLVAPAGDVALIYRAMIENDGKPDAVRFDAEEIPVAQLPDECLHYLSGSRYCETDQLTELAWQLFGQTKPGWTRVQAICDFVHERLKFSYPNASALRTAFGAYNERTGVCRDFAHLAITLCRCMNIPARYVNGYLGDIGVPADPAPMDFSAWFEVYLSHTWFTFDARHNVPRIGRIVIARGRDAADVAMITSYGLHTLTQFHVVADEVLGTPSSQQTLIHAA
jgi:transglutaminase-like putative cysteine protease